ncbi:hypothetical protein ICE98_03617 [Lactococcus lactis]|nr:hypothetical protein [Lactococcus lactis]
MKKETIISRVLMVVALFITFYFKELFPKLWLLFTLITALILGIYVSYRVKIKDKNSKSN